jgi:DNA-binding MarR family transcriptional regulator
MFLDSRNVFGTILPVVPNVQPRPDPQRPRRSDRGSVEPSRREIADTSELVLRLIHEAYASRGLGTEPDTHGATTPPLSRPAIRAIIHLHQHGRRTMGELARGLDVSFGWASRIARELEDAGLLAREPDPDDRRVVRVSLTPSAIEHLEGTYRWHGEAIRRALEPLTPRQREAVRTFLRVAGEQLRQPSSEGDAR